MPCSDVQRQPPRPDARARPSVPPHASCAALAGAAIASRLERPGLRVAAEPRQMQHGAVRHQRPPATVGLSMRTSWP